MRSKMASWCVAATLLALTAMPAFAAGSGWLGVTTQPTDEDLRRGLDLSRDGLLVNQVSQDSPADRAGLRKGDVILTYNSRTVTEPEDLRQLVRDTEPGRTVSLSIWRDGARRTLRVTVGDVSNSGDDNAGFD
jgi:serine protease Do